MIRNPRSLGRSAAFVLLAFGLCAVILPSVGSAFRDNDQAALISGEIQFLRGQMSPWHSWFYNYDKQWGSYALLTGLSALTPRLDPVLRGNLLEVGLLVPAMLLSLYAIARRSRAPLWACLPLFLCPGLLLYAPFLSTASLSLAFLFLCFYCLQMGWRWAALLAIAVAAACRGDVALVAPIIAFTSLSRRSFWGLLRTKFAWLAAAAAVAPVLFGKLISGLHFSDLAGIAIQPALFAGFLTFGLGLGAVLLLGATVAGRLGLIWNFRRWRFFYLAELAALLLPIVFYWLQLYSPRYFFLTLIALLFACVSRRGAVLMAHVPRAVPASILVLTLLPWFVGISLPSVRHIRPALTQPSTFPTADGLFPMGAYGAFAFLSTSRDHLEIDHNQKTWESALSTDFKTCNGMVPVMATPMSYYLDVAIRLQGKLAARIVDITQTACGGAYVDLRAVIRHDSLGMDVARTGMSIVSRRPELGRPIVWMTNNQDPSALAQAFRELEAVLHGKDAEVYVGQGVTGKEFAPGTHSYFFSVDGTCQSPIKGANHLCLTPGASDLGYARTVFPDYISK